MNIIQHYIPSILDYGDIRLWYLLLYNEVIWRSSCTIQQSLCCNMLAPSEHSNEVSYCMICLRNNLELYNPNLYITYLDDIGLYYQVLSNTLRIRSRISLWIMRYWLSRVIPMVTWFSYDYSGPIHYMGLSLLHYPKKVALSQYTYYHIQWRFIVELYVWIFIQHWILTFILDDYCMIIHFQHNIIHIYRYTFLMIILPTLDNYPTKHSLHIISGLLS